MTGTAGVKKNIKVLKSQRIFLVGNTSAGKSSLANTIFGEDVFKINQSTICRASECQAESKSVHGRRITVIDTPSFFDTNRPEEEMKAKIGRCITECAPGPHVILIVLTVEQEQDITKICQYFPDEAFKYAAVVFTHGEQLPEGMKIEEFVEQNECLRDLVKKCSGRCHVVDNENWKNNEQCDYRSNKVQVAELLNTIDKIVIKNKGGCYTDKMLHTVKIKTEENSNMTSEGHMPQSDTNNELNSVSRNVWLRLTGPEAESLAEDFFGQTFIVLQDAGGIKKGTREGIKDKKAEIEDEIEEETVIEENNGSETEEEDLSKDTEEKEDGRENGKKKESKDKSEAKNVPKKNKKSHRSGNFFSTLWNLCFGAAVTALAGLGAAISALAGRLGTAVAALAQGLGAAAPGGGATGARSAGAAAPGGGAAGARAAASGGALFAAGVGGALTLAGLEVTAIWLLWLWILEKIKKCKEFLQQHGGIIFLVTVFYSLLLLSFYVQEPVAQTLLLMCGVLLLLLLTVD